jgi:hypothetical protein
VVAAGQTLIVGLGLVTDLQVSPIVAILLAVVGVPVAVVRNNVMLMKTVLP